VKTTSPERLDVLVIGGGPIGAVAAWSAALGGARVTLVERRDVRAAPSACTGLVSPRTLDALGASKRSVLGTIRAVEAVSPNGHRIRVRSDVAKAFVLDRIQLEQELHGRAHRAGVTIRRRTEAVSLEPGGVLLRGPEGERTLRPAVTILATGHETALSRHASVLAPPRTFLAAQTEVEQRAEAEDQVTVYLGTDVAPGFFGWAVPIGEGRLRVGLAVRPGADPKECMDRLLRERFAKAPILTRSSGIIPIGLVREPFADRLLVVGDTAGHVKPLSGGGLYIGALCGRIAGRKAARAALSGQTGHQDLADYGIACERAVGSELRYGLAARALLEALSDREMDEALEAVDHPDLLRFLAEVGDIDRLRLIPRKLATEPSLWKRLLPLLTLLDGYLDGPDGSGSIAA